MVYGASPDNPVPIDERAPLLAEPDGSVVGDFMEIEQLAERSPRTNPGMEITVARPGGAGRREHRHADHQAFRGAATAGGQGLRPALAVLPRG